MVAMGLEDDRADRQTPGMHGTLLSFWMALWCWIHGMCIHQKPQDCHFLPGFPWRILITEFIYFVFTYRFFFLTKKFW